MRSLVLGVLALSALVFTAAPSAAQYTLRYPWCAYYGGPGTSTYNCGFSTFQQCLATISGIGGYCDRNPYYRGRPEPPRRRRH
ncbi:MAG TPA: DUF3551 domain-containing protein [Xanthobacteraceae bacterium]|nr:DUF3551 domain-containing protein [Xanthobacteraceae bacterium]